ncbi:hypothetical protein TCA2_4475 [Paenibacillus sp. TCA20]|nr:hypothetical protein TCA2_4475 [Paenibacillus sp. TCA20]
MTVFGIVLGIYVACHLIGDYRKIRRFVLKCKAIQQKYMN